MGKLLATSVVSMACLAHAPAFALDDAATILRTSAESYAALRSYSDVGVVETDVGGDVSFDTAFVKPDRFRFAWKVGHPFILLRFETITAIVRSEGPRTTTWRKVHHEEPTERVDSSLSMAIAGATGVSSGSAYTIATLLMPTLWGREDSSASVLVMSSPRLLADETIDRVSCRHLSGLSRHGDPVDLWIGIDDHLVRRLDTTDGGFHSSETRHDVRINASIAPAVFAETDVRH